ncbi:unnamed protein product [Ascophyllum nodosum]
MKIIDKIKHAMDAQEPFYSFEFFPPKTAAGVENLSARMERMAKLEPLFVDVTWGAGGSTSDLTLAISVNAQKYLGVEVLMHLTCTNLKVEEIKDALNRAREAGIKNILALRGDPAKGLETWEAAEGGLRHAIDLVRLIRKEHGDYFGVAVAGHPEGHTDGKGQPSLSSSSPSQEDHGESGGEEEERLELQRLKEKVDAGADFVITQFFYDTEAFLRYARRCREVGITCPIIPGIMAIQNYTAFTRMTQFCETRVPPEIREALKPICSDDEAVKNYGVGLGIKMCKRLMDGGAPGLHFYTLNLERSVRLILDGLGYAVTAATRRSYPWRASALSKRASEDVRRGPINWANRPRSYLARTEIWDEYPNGRWGDGRSPAFGELSDTHFFRFLIGSKEDRKAMWGEAPIAPEDIFETFASYIEGRIPKLPWCEVSLQAESKTIDEKLANINRRGFLTINSQPAVNGARSDHPVYGWGGGGGRVYQKAYVEFFASEALLDKILEACKSRAELNYYAVDVKGRTRSRGIKNTTALSWGVFPNREVQQPTIFDPETYMVWKDEAFRLWVDLWASLYDDESRSAELLYGIHDSYYLVAVVDNDFIDGNLWEIFDEKLMNEGEDPPPPPSAGDNQ